MSSHIECTAFSAHSNQLGQVAAAPQIWAHLPSLCSLQHPAQLPLPPAFECASLSSMLCFSSANCLCIKPSTIEWSLNSSTWYKPSHLPAPLPFPTPLILSLCPSSPAFFCLPDFQSSFRSHFAFSAKLKDCVKCLYLTIYQDIS
jgi:hypothetical protein